MGFDHIGYFSCIHVRVFAHALSAWRDPSFRGMVWPSANGPHPVLGTSSRYCFCPFSQSEWFGFRFDLSLITSSSSDSGIPHICIEYMESHGA